TANTWNLTGANAGTINGTAFTAIEKLTGGSGEDTFKLTPVTGNLSGSINGGGGNGNNTLDYSAYTTSVVVDLGMKTATAINGVSNINIVIGGSGNDTLTGISGGVILLG